MANGIYLSTGIALPPSPTVYCKQMRQQKSASGATERALDLGVQVPGTAYALRILYTVYCIAQALHLHALTLTLTPMIMNNDKTN